MIRTLVKFNNKKARNEDSSRASKQRQLPKFSAPTRRKYLQTQPASLQSVAKDALYEFSQISNYATKKKGKNNQQNLPQITPWIQSFKQEKSQTSNTLPLFNSQISQQKIRNKLSKLQLLKGNMSRIIDQNNCNSYTTFIKYQCQKAIKTEAAQPSSQQILILKKSFAEQRLKYQQKRILKQHNNNRSMLVQDIDKYVAQQKNPVLVKRKHQSLKAYHISNVSKEVQFLRNQIISNIQKETVVPISIKLSSLNKMAQSKATPIKPMLRRKFSLRGKFNSNSTNQKDFSLLERQEKQKQKQSMNSSSYQCSNPLTKVLYHRFMKTINKSDNKI